MKDSISVIIPCINEAGTLPGLIRTLQKHQAGKIGEIIIVDGGSSDNTVELAQSLGVRVIETAKAGRAFQMNRGAEAAVNPILYFLHADTKPPVQFDESIISSIRNGASGGCFILKFDWNHPALNFYSWFTRLKTSFLRFGDQSLYIKADVFHKIGGFDELHLLMEDQEIISRIKKEGRFDVIQQPVTTSARKYRINGPVRLQLIFTMIWFGYYLGIPQERLKSFYKRTISNGLQAGKEGLLL